MDHSELMANTACVLHRPETTTHTSRLIHKLTEILKSCPEV